MARAEIYYFSGTGNSLSVAEDIAQKIGANLIPIASLIDKKSVKPTADVVGIIFPVYYMEPPMIVEKFVKRLEGLHGKYIFAICTYGGGTGISLRMLNRYIHSSGGVLSAAFGVQMPQNAFFKFWENRTKIFEKTRKKWSRLPKKSTIKRKFTTLPCGGSG